MTHALMCETVIFNLQSYTINSGISQRHFPCIFNKVSVKNVTPRVIASQRGDQPYDLLIKLFHPRPDAVESSGHSSIEVKVFSPKSVSRITQQTKPSFHSSCRMPSPQHTDMSGSHLITGS